VLTLPEIQLEFKTNNAGVGLDIAETEVSVLAILNLGDSALAASELVGHLRLGESGGHPGDNQLVDELSLGRKLANGIGYPAVAMAAKHLVDATISTTRGSGTTGGGFERGHGQEYNYSIME
jgi:hypothetical protein